MRTLAGQPLSEVVSYLEQRRDDLDPREGPATLDRPDAVQLMTVHGAKGLEFPIVFVPEAHLGPVVGWDVVRWSREDGVSLTLERDEDDDNAAAARAFTRTWRDRTDRRRRRSTGASSTSRRRVQGTTSTSPGTCRRRMAGCGRRAKRDASGALRDIEVREPVQPDTGALAQQPASARPCGLRPRPRRRTTSRRCWRGHP